MKPFGSFPTPYGVSVPVFSANNPADPDEVLFDMEGTAIFAGIHDPKERVRFAADAKASGCVSRDLAAFGGGPVPRVSIGRPEKPAYPQIPSKGDAAMPIENWVTLIMDTQRWCDRSKALLDIIGSNLDQGGDWQPMLALGIQIMLTGTLEHLAEREIDCIEAAAFYALTVHDEWSGPAIAWLTPMRATWFKDWVATRPAYRRFATLCRKGSDLPKWISGGSTRAPSRTT